MKMGKVYKVLNCEGRKDREVIKDLYELKSYFCVTESTMKLTIRVSRTNEGRFIRIKGWLTLQHMNFWGYFHRLTCL